MAFSENLAADPPGAVPVASRVGPAGRLHALTITRLEAGATAPSTRTVRALADALGVEPRELALPEEVAELRRLDREAARPDPGAGDRRDA